MPKDPTKPGTVLCDMHDGLDLDHWLPKGYTFEPHVVEGFTVPTKHGGEAIRALLGDYAIYDSAAIPHGYTNKYLVSLGTNDDGELLAVYSYDAMYLRFLKIEDFPLPT